MAQFNPNINPPPIGNQNDRIGHVPFGPNTPLPPITTLSQLRQEVDPSFMSPAEYRVFGPQKFKRSDNTNEVNKSQNKEITGVNNSKDLEKTSASAKDISDIVMMVGAILTIIITIVVLSVLAAKTDSSGALGKLIDAKLGLTIAAVSVGVIGAAVAVPIIAVKTKKKLAKNSKDNNPSLEMNKIQNYGQHKDTANKGTGKIGFRDSWYGKNTSSKPLPNTSGFGASGVLDP